MTKTASSQDASDPETRTPDAEDPDRGAPDGTAPPDPYACYITDEDQAHEQAARLQALMDGAQTVEQIEEGLRFELPREEGLAETAAAFAVLESWCCPWARFELAFQRQRQGLVLEVTAPGDEEAAALIHAYPAGEIPDEIDLPELPHDFEVEQPGLEG